MNMFPFKLLFPYLLIILSCGFLQAQQGTITKVIDGDTYLIKNLETNQIIKVRLWGIDTPEKNQPFGMTAKNYCIDRYLNKTIDVNIKSIDRYGRTVAVLSLGNEIINEHLIKVGLAWDYHYYSKSEIYVKYQKEAMNNKVGLWSEAEPVEPQVWRKTH